MSVFALIGMVNTIVSWRIIAKVAPSRGRRVWPYAVLAFFIGVFSLIPLYALPNRHKRVVNA